MRSLLFYSIVSIALFTGCGNNTEHYHSSDDTTGQSSRKQIEAPKDERDVTGCYMRVTGRDTLVVRLNQSVVRLNQSGDNIIGNIYYDNFEKDGSSGTASGKMVGDTIKLYYHFQSEGMKSVSELYFKVENNSLLSGNGEIAVKGDTAYFSAPNNIQFPAEGRLRKLPCDSLTGKFLK